MTTEKKNVKRNQSIAARLHSIENGISGALNSPEILERMNRYGYTAERIAEGERLLTGAKQQVALHAEEYSGQYVATGEVGQLWPEAYSDYMITLKVVRVAFRRQPGKLQEFNATGRRNRSLSGWLNDARVLYTNLQTPEALNVMTGYGYTPERLQREQQKVEDVAALHVKQLGETGEAQQSTKDRDKAIDDLCDWYSDFRAIARVALYDKPQLLEALGIVRK
ncbi:MAG: hypothetical protein LBF85_02510 [Tannerella sp.]|jgi:hypothetical protein|nr:hypothetical protein [Tannerella sp.]